MLRLILGASFYSGYFLFRRWAKFWIFVFLAKSRARSSIWTLYYSAISPASMFWLRTFSGSGFPFGRIKMGSALMIVVEISPIVSSNSTNLRCFSLLSITFFVHLAILSSNLRLLWSNRSFLPYNSSHILSTSFLRSVSSLNYRIFLVNSLLVNYNSISKRSILYSFVRWLRFISSGLIFSPVATRALRTPSILIAGTL